MQTMPHGLGRLLSLLGRNALGTVVYMTSKMPRRLLQKPGTCEKLPSGCPKGTAKTVQRECVNQQFILRDALRCDLRPVKWCV